MNWQYTPYIIPLIIAAGVSITVFITSWRRRPAPGAVPLAILMLAVTEWSLGYIFELGGLDLATKTFWSKVEYLGIVSVSVAWLVLALHYNNYEKWLTIRNIVLVSVVPVITLLLAWTNELHGLIWRSAEIDSSGPFLARSVSYGGWFWVHAAYSYVLLVLGTILVIRMLLRSSNLYRWQAGALVTSVLIPWIGNGIYLSGSVPIPNLDITPFAFTLSGLAFAWGLFRFKFLDIVPIARRTVVDVMSDGVIVLDIHNRISDLNPAAQKIIGCTMSDAIGRPAAEVLSKWPALLKRFHNVTEISTEIAVNIDQREFHFDMRISPLYDRKQVLTGRLVVVRDITEQIQAKKQLHRQALTFENISDSVIITDLAGLIIDCNPATEKMFGYSKAEALGKAPAIWYKPGEYEGFRRTIIDGITQDGRWTGEINFIRRDNIKGVCEAIVLPLLDEHGQQVATIGVSRDITQRKEVEKQLHQAKEVAEAANRAKSTFLANMSHELRTPLTVMIGYSEMLQEDAEALGYSDFVPQLERIWSSGSHLLSIISDILDMSKIEAGKMELELETFEPSTLINEVITALQPMINKNNNSLQLKETNPLGTIHSDPTKVRQILYNLMSNATKFTEQGSIGLSAMRESGNGQDWINFQVSDSGIGMTPAQMAGLFQPFTQVDPTMTRKYGGTGLGLSISRRLCQMMGGTISVESKPGQGSTFTVRLPTKVVKPQLINPSTLPAPDEALELQKSS